MGEVMTIKINKFICVFILILFFVLLLFNGKVVLGVKNGINLSLDISFGSLQNQILRSNLLRSIIRDRKILK